MSRWGIVYDFADRWPNVHHMAFLFAFPLFLFGVYYQQQRAIKNAAISWRRLKPWPSWLRTAVGWTIGGEALSLLLIGTLLRDYHHTKTIYDQRQYLTVEGPVSHFDPMPKAGHKQESFRVNGVPFTFSTVTRAPMATIRPPFGGRPKVRTPGQDRLF
jgi:hypothetical protein